MKPIISLLVFIMLLNVICPSLLAIEKALDSITLKSSRQLSGTITGYNKQVVYFKTDTGALYKIQKTNIMDLVTTDELRSKVYANGTKYPSNHLSYDELEFVKAKPDKVKNTLNTASANESFLVVNTEIDSLPTYQRLHIQQLQAINKNVQMIWLTSLLMVLASLATAASLSQ
jgi:hypothetical protein